jgi:hypothetical protein
MKQDPAHDTLARLTRLYLKITVGVIAAFFVLWAIAAATYRGGYVWHANKIVPNWQLYLGTLIWYAIMAYLVGAIWICTKEPSLQLTKRSGIDITSRRLSRCLLAAFPFLGLGFLIGKSFDPFKQIVGTVSGIAAIAVIGSFLVRDIIKWKRRHNHSAQ